MGRSYLASNVPPGLCENSTDFAGSGARRVGAQTQVLASEQSGIRLKPQIDQMNADKSAAKCAGAGGKSVHRAELMTVEVFFLNEPDGHHAVLLEPAIKLAAIDPEGRRGAHLVSAKLL